MLSFRGVWVEPVDNPVSLSHIAVMSCGNKHAQRTHWTARERTSTFAENTQSNSHLEVSGSFGNRRAAGGTRGNCRELTFKAGGVVRLVRTPVCLSRRRPRARVPSLPPISENSGSVCWFRTLPENLQSLIDKNSDQPTSKGAFIFKVRRLAGCASPAVLYG